MGLNLSKLKELKDKRILVLGFARSGYKTAKILNELGITVILNANEDLTNNEEAMELNSLGVKIISGGHPLELLNNIDIIIKNPGIPYKIPFLQEAIKLKKEIITEVELASILFNNEIIAITGTNGKTTTTTLIYEMLKLINPEVRVAGNIGYPAIEVAFQNDEKNPIIMEISSFQLNGTKEFKPHIAIITNLGSSHLDYHGTEEEYHKIKKRIFANQTENDYLILNIEHKDQYLRDKISSNVIYYSTKENKELDAHIFNGWFVYKGDNIFEVSKLALPGEHNLENAINAAIVAILKKIDIKYIQKVLYNFSGVKHRLQYLGLINDVKYYNDSKSTNPTAISKALSGFSKNVILICGGLNRFAKLDELAPYSKVIKKIISIGETAEQFYQFALENGIEAEKAENVKDATLKAYDFAKKDDIILLSPGCASWDQYANFEVRGEEFIDTFNTLKNRAER